MTASIARVRGHFGNLPVPLEMVLGDMQVVNAAILKGLFDTGAR